MAILSSDIKLMASQKLTDSDDAGGRMSGVEIVDGVINNIFPDVSRLDRTYGRVNLRKAFALVDTANTNTYYGAHVIVLENPADSKIGTLLFEGNPADTRLTAETRIEAFVAESSEVDFYLYGVNTAGSRQIKAWQNQDRSVPEIGQVFVIKEFTSAGGSTLAFKESVLVTSVTIQEKVAYEDTQGAFYKRVLTLGLSRPLANSFAGIVPQRYTPPGAYTSHIISTVANDSGRYYGTMPLSVAGLQGDLSVKAASAYGQLLPSTQAESPILGIKVASTKWMEAAAISAISFTSGWMGSSTYTYRMGIAIAPKTFRAGVPNQNISGFPVDDGNGNFNNGAGVTGTINYETGVVVGTLPYQSAQGIQFSFMPAGVATPFCRTKEIAINISTRGYNYPVTLTPKPSPRSVTIDYRALNRWYRLTDDGLGHLSGSNSSFGGGTVDYTTGNVLFTAGALPDVDTSIIITWGSNVDYTIDVANPAIKPPVFKGNIPRVDIDFSTNAGVVTWTVNNISKTATMDANGNFTSANGSGYLDKYSGDFLLIPTASTVPDYNSRITVALNQINITARDFGVEPTGNPSGAIGFIVNGGSPIVAGSLKFSYQIYVIVNGQSLERTVSVMDDGLGKVYRINSLVQPTVRLDMGTVNYTTGEVLIADVTQFGTYQIYDMNTKQWTSSIKTYAMLPADGSGHLSYIYGTFNAVGDTSTTAPVTYTITGVTTLSLDFTPDSIREIVPGSLMFNWHGDTYRDFGNGLLVRGWDWNTQSSTPAGFINYTTGEVSITSWAAPNAGAFSITTLLTKYGDAPVSEFIFRVPGSPLRNGSVYVQGNNLNGTLLNGQQDLNGNLTGNITGVVRSQSGIVSANSSSPLVPSTITYNAVVLVNLPLEKAILGIDPINLPQDGRVPMYRPGNVLVVHNMQQTTLQNPLSAGQAITLSRDNLAEVLIYDAAGVLVPTTKYTVNLVTGVITFSNPLDLSAFTQPLVAHHRIEDMTLCTDVQIDGTLSMSAGLSRDYPIGSKVSSALVWGDIYAREYLHFSQTTWTGVWSDALIGSTTTPQFNWVLYPLTLLNHNAIEERWALIFTSSTGGTVNGETIGQVGTFSTSVDVAPNNPVTSQAYFTLNKNGFGTGWAAGNVIRFNTKGGHVPFWISRSVAMGAQAQSSDGIRIQIRGDSA